MAPFVVNPHPWHRPIVKRLGLCLLKLVNSKLMGSRHLLLLLWVLSVPTSLNRATKPTLLVGVLH